MFTEHLFYQHFLDEGAISKIFWRFLGYWWLFKGGHRDWISFKKMAPPAKRSAIRCCRMTMQYNRQISYVYLTEKYIPVINSRYG